MEPRVDHHRASTVRPQPLLEIRGLRTYFYTESGVAKAVDGVDLDIRQGEVLGLVGESGSGKSVTALSVLRLIPDPPGRIVGGRDPLQRPRPAEAAVGRDPRDPRQRHQHGLPGADDLAQPGLHDRHAGDGGHPRARERAAGRRRDARAVEMLTEVGIPDAAARMKQYPHNLSGGMRQRVMIAMALVAESRRCSSPTSRRRRST